MLPQIADGSDSENDEDYIPPASGNESPSSSTSNKSRSSEKRRKKRRIGSPLVNSGIQEQTEADRQALWDEFTSSASTTSKTSGQTNTPSKTVTVEIKYKFAGQEVIQKREVPEDSEEAKEHESSPAAPKTSTDAAVDPTIRDGLPGTLATGTQGHPPDNTAVQASPVDKNPDAKAQSTARRPPRRSLTALAASAKPKKLNTLEKSKMDWNTHLASSSREELDELERNRKTGGYLDKMDFLGRVGERKEDVLDGGSNTRR